MKTLFDNISYEDLLFQDIIDLDNRLLMMIKESSPAVYLKSIRI